MRFLFKMMLAPISLFVAFLALMAKWLLTLSSYVVAPLMLYIFGCGIYTVYRQTWDQFLILLVAEFLCFVLFVGATAMAVSYTHLDVYKRQPSTWSSTATPRDSRPSTL